MFELWVGPAGNRATDAIGPESGVHVRGKQRFKTRQEGKGSDKFLKDRRAGK